MLLSFGKFYLLSSSLCSSCFCSLLKICPRKTSDVKSKGKELYTFSREIKKEDTETVETYGLLLPEGKSNISQYSYIIMYITLNLQSLYQNVRATADNSHERSINTFPSFVKSSRKEIEDEYEVQK